MFIVGLITNLFISWIGFRIATRLIRMTMKAVNNLLDRLERIVDKKVSGGDKDKEIENLLNY